METMIVQVTGGWEVGGFGSKESIKVLGAISAFDIQLEEEAF